VEREGGGKEGGEKEGGRGGGGYQPGLGSYREAGLRAGVLCSIDLLEAEWPLLRE
jgi:hypothetical protein